MNQATTEQTLRVAIVGSGPAGFYAAGHLLSASEPSVEVDMFDRLATPWGLVRAGVAPDHPKVKAITRLYERTASAEGFRFHGNVEIGVDLQHAELMSAYHAVLYAVGAPNDRKLGVPGEDLPGAHAATEFVAWYNGHPDYADRRFDLSATRAVVVGNGNVALDVARMLVRDVELLRRTDTADHAIEALAGSAIEEVVVLGRRGPAQAAYTDVELRELGELEEADVVVDAADASLDEPSQAFLDSDAAGATTRRNVEIVQGYAGRPPGGKRKRIVLRFKASPVEIVGRDRVEGVRVVRNELLADDDGRIVATPSGAPELIEAGLVLRSIGYRGTPIPGVPFDDRRGTLHNDGGRVTDPRSGAPVPGVYVAGWVKRGPSGVIGTNKRDAHETVALLLDDLAAGRLAPPVKDRSTLLASLAERGVEVVDYSGWQLIDAHERALGEPHGRPRVKLVRRDEHLLHAGRRGG
jgi:ferredoxin--NADP+ reductase